MIHPGFPRSRSYNPCSVKPITINTTTDLGNIPTSSTLHWGTLGPSLWTNTNTKTNTNTLTAKYLKSREIPSLKPKKNTKGSTRKLLHNYAEKCQYAYELSA